MSHNLVRLPPIRFAPSNEPQPPRQLPVLWVHLPTPGPAPERARPHTPRVVEQPPRGASSSYRFVPSKVSPRKRARSATLPHTAPHELHAGVRFPVALLEHCAWALLPEQQAQLRAEVYPTIVAKKYSAPALDLTRSHLLVYEYPIGAHWVIWDHDTGFVHLTGLWRAAVQESALHGNRNGLVAIKPNAKADIVKLLELTPRALHSQIRRMRGGFLKIQGTWVPHSLCKSLARRFCYYIRYKLVPIFGADFPALCLLPTDYGFGQLRYDEPHQQPRPLYEEPRPLYEELRREERRLFEERRLLDAPPVLRGATMAHYQITLGPDVRPAQGPRWLAESVLQHLPLQLLPPPLHVLPPHLLPPVGAGHSLAPTLPKTLPKMQGNDHMSYTEMIDIVNASKCLQLLSRLSLETRPAGRGRLSIEHLLS